VAVVWVGVVAGVVAVVAVGWRLRPGVRRAKANAQIRQEIAQGRYHRAVPFLLRAGRLAEAARLEAFRGNADRAVSLYEQAGDARGAASIYMTRGEYVMAAMLLRDAGLELDAAEAFVDGKQPDKAVKLLAKANLWDQARSVAEASGDPSLLAQVLAATGDRRAASRLLAEQAQTTGELEVAVLHWRDAGEPRRAAKLLVQTGKHAAAAPLLEELGDHAAAAGALLEAGELDAAGDVFMRAQQHESAGRAYLRAGETAKAAEAFERGGQWVALARIHHDRGEETLCLDALGRVEPGAEAYEEAQSLTADIHRGAGRAHAAYASYEALVAAHLASGRAEPVVRRWVTAMAEILYRNGNESDALKCLASLEEHGLMTDALESRIDGLRKAGSGQGGLASISALELPEHERYDFVGRLGEGGNGVIFRARDKMLARDIAIKMIGRTKLPSEVARTYFMREAQMAAQLNHPNIVTIFDLGQIEDRMYIAMEMIEGESLAERLVKQGSTLPWHDAKPLIEQLCTALDYAHERGVIHLDVKLENVMVTPAGVVKLMDFGLARAFQQGPDAVDFVMGTPLYMSPEQTTGVDVDHRTDIYALGVTLFRIFTGTWPYRTGNIVEAHRRAPIPDPRTVKPKLPEAFSELIMGTMAKSAADRPESAGDVAQALRVAFAGR